jgi:lysine-specific histone demethylase 1B
MKIKYKKSSMPAVFLMLVLTLFACNENNLPAYNIPDDARVIVIGAGAAGLYAGKILDDNQVNFTILEASDRIGGRLKKESALADFDLDLGAEWIHGKKALTYDLAMQHAVEIFEDNSSFKIWYDQQIFDEDRIPGDLLPIFNYIDAESQSAPDEPFLNWAVGQGYGPETFDLLGALAGDYGASADKISFTQTAIESQNWSSGKNDYKFRDQTYFDLIDRLIARQIEEHVLLNSPVTKIDYRGDEVLVTAGDSTYAADRVIITVSVNVLKSNFIEFIPPLSASKTEAIDKIGMDAGMKVYLKFDAPIFQDQYISGAPVGSSYYDAGYGKNSETPVLGVFIMGEKAETLSGQSEEETIQDILTELDGMTGGLASIHYAGQYALQDWRKEPFVLGAYSYSTVGIGNARTVLAQPVSNKLFFAGEATHLTGHYQTVQGAMETGKREAEKVMRSF